MPRELGELTRMKNSEYWKQRSVQLNDALFRKSEKAVRDLEREYRKAHADIKKDIEIWLRRIADNNELSLHEAKKLLKTAELEEFKWTVEEYIAKGKENALDQRLMKQLENASARVHINRLEAMQLQIRHNLEVLADNQNKSMADLNKELLSEGYYRTIYEVQKGIGQGYQFSLLQPERINTIAAKPWALDRKNFSARIWESKEKLINELQSNLTQAFIRGAAPDKTIQAIVKRFDVSRKQAGRLVMTESAYFAAEGQRQAYQELDIEQYEIVATLDNHTSELCQSLDGKIVDMKDYHPGSTAPPFHPWCRTVTCPYFEDNYTERAAREADGKIYYVDGNIKYKEWYNGYVKPRQLPKTITVKEHTFLPKQLGFKDYKGVMQFIPKNTEITDVHIIAGSQVNAKHRAAQRLSKVYGGKEEDWGKKVGKIESAKYVFDVHWVEHPKIGAKEYKIANKKVKE